MNKDEHEPQEPENIPALFATIHFQSDTRPDGYTPDQIEDMNIEANRHIPELYEKLRAERDARRRRD